MRRLAPLAVSLGAAFVAACASVLGIDDVHDDCADCGIDGALIDTRPGEVATVDRGGAEAAVDAPPSDAGADVGREGGDASFDSGVGESGLGDAGGCNSAACAAEGGACCGSACLDVSNDPAHCGGCSNVCSSNNIVMPTCSGGVCTGACVGGFADCNNDKLTDGCEANLGADPANCGACGNVCTSGLCGTSIGSWAAGAAWVLNGAATLGTDQFGAQTAILTPLTANVAGSIVYANPIVTDELTATFSFYIGGGTGADGMGFMIEADGSNALGTTGGCLGMCGLNGYGVELDTYNNAACGDADGNHVAVDLLSGCTGLPNMLAANGGLPFVLSAGATHTATVQLTGGAMTVSIDGTTYLGGISLPSFAPGTPYFYGFSAGTGGETDFQEVSPQLSITFPTPRCL